MVDLPDIVVDLPGTMVDLPDTVVDLPDTKGWSLYQVYPVWFYLQNVTKFFPIWLDFTIWTTLYLPLSSKWVRYNQVSWSSFKPNYTEWTSRPWLV